MKTKEVCSHCGHEFPRTELTEFDGEFLCPACLETEPSVCEDCGRRIWNDNNEGSGDLILCGSCYERNYVHCSRGGRLLHENNAFYFGDDDEPYCESCHDMLDSRIIHEYSYRPAPNFYGNGPRFFGVELEIDEGGEYESKAKKLLNVANRDTENIYIKHDGSLDEGLELVTHPMSLEYQLTKMPWVEVMAEAVRQGYRSHQANTCGLHVHVSREAFGAFAVEQDSAIARVLFFVERHWNELLKFSRRTQRQLERWAARYGYKDHPTEMMEHVKKGRCNRYTCVNLTNEDTIEFRIFRGTLKYNTLIATLQMVNRICDVAICMSDDELRAMSWSEFVSGVTEPELIQYLKERRLYLNEPVAVSEEV